MSAAPGPPAPDPVSPGPWKLVWVSPKESEFEGVGYWDVYREEAALRETGPNQFQADLRDVRAVNVACLVGCSEADARYIVALRNQAGAADPAPPAGLTVGSLTLAMLLHRAYALNGTWGSLDALAQYVTEQPEWITPVSPGAPPAALSKATIEAAAHVLWRMGNLRVGERPWETVGAHYMREAEAALRAALAAAPA